jgi:hypothetical protein
MPVMLKKSPQSLLKLESSCTQCNTWYNLPDNNFGCLKQC